MESTKVYSVEEATRKLEHYCAYQERCHAEVEKKLKEMRMIPLAIDTIIVHLIKENYLNEERFARSFARGKFRIKKWGWTRIERELEYRRVSRYNIQLAYEEIEEEYWATFDEVAQKKYETISEKNPHKARKKLADYLLYKGWESEMVYEKVFEFYPSNW